MDTARFTSLLNIVALIAIMLSMGLQVKVADVLASARQTRFVGLGLVANYVVVPLLTLGLLQLFHADRMVSMGFLILAVCPGAPLAPPLTAVAKGSLPSAVGLMVILASSSAFLSPILLSRLLVFLAPDGELHIDYLAIVRTLLVVQLLPLGVGLSVCHFAPKMTERITKPIAFVGNLLLIALIGTILATQYQTLAAIRLRGWFGMSLLLGASLGIGWISGGATRATRKALAVTTAVRNAAVALVIATTNFADTPAVTAVVAYGLVSSLGGLAFAVLLGRAMPDESSNAIRFPE